MAAVFKAIVKWRLLATVLCVAVLAASVDTLPDPPALNPSRSEAKASGPAPRFDGSCRLNGNFASVALTAMYVVRWLDFGYVLETAQPIHRASLVRHASDSSPPDFSFQG